MGPLANARHESFAVGVTSGKSHREAYRDAFGAVSDRSADNKSQTLLNKPEVGDRILELKNVAAQKVILTKDWILEQMVDAHDQARDDKAHPSRIRALELLGREKGAFTEQREYTLRSFDQMTSEEIEAFLAGETAKGIAPTIGKPGRNSAGRAQSRDGKPRSAGKPSR